MSMVYHFAHLLHLVNSKNPIYKAAGCNVHALSSATFLFLRNEFTGRWSCMFRQQTSVQFSFGQYLEMYNHRCPEPSFYCNRLVHTTQSNTQYRSQFILCLKFGVFYMVFLNTEEYSVLSNSSLKCCLPLDSNFRYCLISTLFSFHIQHQCLRCIVALCFFFGV